MYNEIPKVAAEPPRGRKLNRLNENSLFWALGSWGRAEKEAGVPNTESLEQARTRIAVTIIC